MVQGLSLLLPAVGEQSGLHLQNAPDMTVIWILLGVVHNQYGLLQKQKGHQSNIDVAKFHG